MKAVPHIYSRMLDPNAEDSLAKIVGMVPPGSMVLDLGAGPGVLANYLREQLGCTVDCVEYNDEAALLALPYCRTLQIADLEHHSLSGLFPGRRYDCIVCADVLEHLRAPEQVLTQLIDLLKPDGRVLISIPNAAYAGLILDLADGHFDYRDEGLLDRTHLRFFTRRSIIDLLEALGYAVERIEPVRMPFEHSEFAKRWDHYPAVLKEHLLAKPEADVYQYLVVAGAKTASDGEQEARQGPAAAVPYRVDVIIVVDGGLDALRRCLASLFASRQQTPLEIVVVNDACPDESLSDYLQDLAREGRITLLEHPAPLGLAGAANRALVLHPERDAVLLSRCAEVHGDWLDRLYRCAYGEADVATVTPFANDAGICSYPRASQTNSLPQGWSLAALDECFAGVNRGRVLEIPESAGVCTYIRRRCLIQAGYFDTLNFPEIGEAQRDLSLRTRELGFKHLLCGDTYVYRQPEGACSAQGATPLAAAEGVLSERYPDYRGLMDRHCTADRERVLRRRVDLARLGSSPRDKLLFISHRLSGGTEKHVRDLAGMLESEFEVLLLRPTGPEGVSVEWASTGEDFRAYFRMPFAYGDLLGFLKSLGVVRIHYHHVMELHRQVMQLAEDLGVPYDFTLHDYYPICPQYMLVRTDGRYCGEPDVVGCNACLAERPALWGLDIGAWRSLFGHLLAGADRVIAPSRDILERVRRYVPAANYRYLPHPEPAVRMPSAIRCPSPEGELKVLVLGLLSLAKGVRLLEACAADARERRLPLFFQVIGSTLEPVGTAPAIPLCFSGPYEEEQLPLLIARARADIVFFPALWPETYSYTLSAAMATGLPIAAPRLGVFPERLAAYPAASLLDWDSTPQAWNELFLSLRNQPAPLARQQDG